MSRSPTVALGLWLGLAAGCGASSATPPRDAATEHGARPLCTALDALDDLRLAMGQVTAHGASTEVGHLVDADEELGHLRRARRRLATVRGDEAASLDDELEQLEAALTTRRAELRAALTALRASREAADAAIEAAARCGEVDLRTPGGREASAPACAPAVRLWSSARAVDVTSAISSSSVAAHVKELRIEGERAAVRDALSDALAAHAEALRALEQVARGQAGSGALSFAEQVRRRSAVTAALDDVRTACLATMTASPRVIGGNPEPRRATVTVRPTWRGFESMPRASGAVFGSGFVVRWRNDAGRVETRIVTNSHVMSGALEAEIVSGDRTLGTGGGAGAAPGEARPLTATLLADDAEDDIAILRVDAPAGDVLQHGVSFRLEPAVEQEVVVAAGFPGVGTRPSFQVSKGTVSNATFGADEDAAPAEAFVQHTAPVDPGNSGGPLLDAEGRLIGMTTFKLVQRENVALAVPTPRIQAAMLRAEEARDFNLHHAEATCNAVLATLSASRPIAPSMALFGLELFDASREAEHPGAAALRHQVEGDAENPIEEARRRAYGAVRAEVEAEGGVRFYTLCEDVKAEGGGGAGDVARFVGTMRTVRGSHQLVFREEHGALRLVDLR